MRRGYCLQENDKEILISIMEEAKKELQDGNITRKIMSIKKVEE